LRLELGTRVHCADEEFGKLADVVVDPAAKRLTHLVVEPRRGDGVARLVPIELVRPADDSSRALALGLTVDEALQLPPVRDAAYLSLGDVPVEDPDWDLGIEEVRALPYYMAYEFEPVPLEFVELYDRVPKNEVELGRGSSVRSADGHELGEVDGFVVGEDDRITHVVLERGHLWGRREVAIPIGAVDTVQTDAVTLNLTRDEVGALPGVRVDRLPRPPRR
jgi:sporulation protein YlmC with PRC-barrel domain